MYSTVSYLFFFLLHIFGKSRILVLDVSDRRDTVPTVNGGVAQPELPLAPLPQAAGLGGVDGQGQAVESEGETLGFGSQPLVDNSPYDSGSPERHRAGIANLGLGLAIAIAMGLGL